MLGNLGVLILWEFWILKYQHLLYQVHFLSRYTLALCMLFNRRAILLNWFSQVFFVFAFFDFNQIQIQLIFKEKQNELRQKLTFKKKIWEIFQNN